MASSIVSYDSVHVAHEGYLEKAKKFFKYGEDFNPQESFYGNALQAAAAERNVKVVRRLLKARADVNAEGGHYGNALQAAAYANSLEVINMLLDAGADVNAKGGHYGNALQAAALMGSFEALERLLEAGADVNAEGGQYGNALLAATALSIDSKVVDKLLEAGANVNAKGGQYGNALQAAAVQGDFEVVERLLEAGADIKAQGGRFGSAFQAAAWSGDLQVVEKLLEAGADVNAGGGECENALQAAAYSRSLEVVNKILETGADVNAEGGHYGNALQAAAYAGGLEIVNTLLETGAEINAEGGHYGNALQAATGSWMSNLKVVNKLLEAGADVNAEGGQYGTSLHAATTRKATDIVKTLIKNHARANIRDFDGLYPLQLAIQQRDSKTIDELLPESRDCLMSIKASEWRSCLRGSTNHLELWYNPSPVIKNVPEKAIQSRNYPLSFGNGRMTAVSNDFMVTDVDSKRIFLLADGNLISSPDTGFYCRWWEKVFSAYVGWEWKSHSGVFVNKKTLSGFLKEHYFVECRFTSISIALPSLEDSIWSDTDALWDFDELRKTHGILWIMTMSEDTSKHGNILESKAFFSTSEYAQVPPYASALLLPLVEELEDIWKGTFQRAEERLSNMRIKLLKSEGLNSKLIRSLLNDSLLWDEIEKTFEKQILDLVDFDQRLRSLSLLHEMNRAVSEDAGERLVERVETPEMKDMDNFSNRIDDLRILKHVKLPMLKETSQNLIQLV
ncbi:uncharacterized protein CTRU02_214234 [Colletotrichum truncatum]|uniref:Uncharacterized protein n=1 Tax=Colletotrichum truncatum TaxID=5467 RepID=A0ACC3YI10_COLTU|nr:uncharacterized protein CTRU02_11309 [Colletotrichum truncatum]KAF6786051.1 hypothetical protein CTRU02_11309 [Colletotrichum truncatum]